VLPHHGQFLSEVRVERGRIMLAGQFRPLIRAADGMRIRQGRGR
jgi:hypothetical protein